MSTWHVIEGSGFVAPDDGLVREWPVDPAIEAVVLDTSDAETDPAEDALLDQVLTMLPPGAAWGTPDGEAIDRDSEMGVFWRGVARVFLPIYRDAWTAALESTVSTMTDSLEDWERDLDLPDQCFGSDQSIETRRRSVIWRELSPATITPGDYLNLALRVGYLIRIEEPEVFECGVSECGLDHETATLNLELEWVVHLAAGPSEVFEAGIGEKGITRLLDWPINEEIECLFRPIRPGWSLLYFDYSEVIGG